MINNKTSNNIENENSPKISIITTTWNRANHIEKAWESIESQIFKDIEWIVCDDGSTDNSAAIIDRILLKSSVPIIFIKSTKRVGKAAMDNLAIKAANSSLIMWNDSDDYLLPNATNSIFNQWQKIKNNDEYAGIIGLASDKFNNLITSNNIISENIDDSWININNKHNINGDGIIALRKDLLLNNPYKEVDFYIPNSSVTMEFIDMKMIVISKILQVREYNSTGNSISFGKKMEYSKGNAYAIYLSELIKRKKNIPSQKKLITTVNFVRYAIHGDINLKKMIVMIKSMGFLVYSIISLPIGLLLSFKDRMQKKVVHTHREFYKSIKSTSITVQTNKSL